MSLLKRTQVAWPPLGRSGQDRQVGCLLSKLKGRYSTWQRATAAEARVSARSRNPEISTPIGRTLIRGVFNILFKFGKYLAGRSVGRSVKSWWAAWGRRVLRESDPRRCQSLHILPGSRRNPARGGTRRDSPVRTAQQPPPRGLRVIPKGCHSGVLARMGPEVRGTSATIELSIKLLVLSESLWHEKNYRPCRDLLSGAGLGTRTRALVQEPRGRTTRARIVWTRVLGP